jgi:hypothetical protein
MVRRRARGTEGLTLYLLALAEDWDRAPKMGYKTSTKPQRTDGGQHVDGRFCGHTETSAPVEHRSIESDDDDWHQDDEQPSP